MSKFQVLLAQHALGDLEDIPKYLRDQVIQDLKSLAISPLPSGSRIKRLRGFRPPAYRLRSGDFRVLYRIQSDKVSILRVIDRKLLERAIRRLNL